MNYRQLRSTHTLADAIVCLVREPLVVLDLKMRIVAASNSFYPTFMIPPDNAHGKLLYELGNGEWDTPGIRTILKNLASEDRAIVNCEVENNYPDARRRTLLLNAIGVPINPRPNKLLLLSVQDLTEQSDQTRHGDEIACQNVLPIEEMQHRFANSLQIVASIMTMKAKAAASEEARQILHEFPQRNMSVAAVQQYLHASLPNGKTSVAHYLSVLCKALSRAMIGDNQTISLSVSGEDHDATYYNIQSLGLIATELIMNSVKRAFDEGSKEPKIVVSFSASENNWELSVADNGVGNLAEIRSPMNMGDGTGIVNAIAMQLDAKVTMVSGPRGTTVSVRHTNASDDHPTALSAFRLQNGNYRSRAVASSRLKVVETHRFSKNGGRDSKHERHFFMHSKSFVEQYPAMPVRFLRKQFTADGDHRGEIRNTQGGRVWRRIWQDLAKTKDLERRG